MLKQILISAIATFLLIHLPGQAKTASDCHADIDSCIVTLKNNLQQAITNHDLNLFAEQFSYPFQVNLSTCTRIIHNKAEFIQNFDTIYSKQDQENIGKAQDSQPIFSNSQGIAIFDSMWASADTAKIFVINAQGKALNCDAPQGKNIAPNQDINILMKFSKLYNEQIAAKQTAPDIETLKIQEKNSEESNLPKYFLADQHSQYVLYTADINNDGENEYVLVYICDGSMCTSDINEAYKLHHGQLQPLNYNNLIAEADWYFNTDTDFITAKDGKYFLNYRHTQPAEVCTYLWQDSKLHLVHGTENICIGL